MRRRFMVRTGIAMLMGMVCAVAQGAASSQQPSALDTVVDQAAQAAMQEFGIPGLAIAITHQGKQRFYNYGVASRQTGLAVTSDTLFELGSISKTFTVTLAAYAQAEGKLALSDSPAKYVPELAGSDFAKLSLVHLATHTGGGFPLQVPDAVKDRAQLMAYLKAWKPQYAAGTQRTYANPSIGMLGMAVANALKQPFTTAMEQNLFPKLGLSSTYIDVPAAKMASYAQGYNQQDAPVRVNPGVLAAEAYGVKSSARDMIRFVDVNLGQTDVAPLLKQAVADTHVGYYELGDMTQDLVWEQYRYPVTLASLLSGNAGSMNRQSHAVVELNPPLAPQAATWINKTGSTNGFGGYVAFVPSKQLGIVILANRNYPNEARVKLAYRILGELGQ